MKLLSVLAVFGFVAAGAACPNGPSQVACEQACASVVRRACASCGGNPSCQVACERARRASCYKCCDQKCTTC
ncbi:uncharacterized protein DNG_07346 [Cephalotrichum gorgonifer]|uniref:Uncharacterized protein n=1 Tax=Cephalotrichum gorgonifer TaxID=2041049 RepID=A0AAE8N1G3_9PEZI|nr:uncharacterized protein DNG_07346 [Cephalotrichum gorgonifer]